MGYYISPDTGSEILYHGSKSGIEGNIVPKSENATDFGEGFYLGTKEIQTLARVSNEANPIAYQFRIDEKYINEQNTLVLSTDDWMYFVLYNRHKLEDLQGTKFYEKYQHLADGKDFIIGPIADDVFDACITNFAKGYITDWTFRQLIDCFDYGLQVVAKSQKACDILEKTSEKSLSKEERKEIKNRRILTRKERIAYYEKKVAKLNSERKGKYLNEIISDIWEQETALQENGIEQGKEAATGDAANQNFSNIKFPNKIHEGDDFIHGIFR